MKPQKGRPRQEPAKRQEFSGKAQKAIARARRRQSLRKRPLMPRRPQNPMGRSRKMIETPVAEYSDALLLDPSNSDAENNLRAAQSAAAAAKKEAAKVEEYPKNPHPRSQNKGEPDETCRRAQKAFARRQPKEPAESRPTEPTKPAEPAERPKPAAAKRQSTTAESSGQTG